MNADHLGDLAAPRTRSARRLILAKSYDRLLSQHTDWKGIDRVVDRLATDVGARQTDYYAALFQTTWLAGCASFIGFMLTMLGDAIQVSPPQTHLKF